MRTPEDIEEMSLQAARRCPTLWGSQHDHGPARSGDLAMLSRGASMLADFIDATFHRCSHRLMHAVDIGPLQKIGSPAIAAEQVLKFVVRDASQQRRIVDLVAVQMKNREHRTMPRRVQELVD